MSLYQLKFKVTASGDVELQEFESRVAATQKWMDSERFKYSTRPYTAKDVVRFQGSQSYDIAYPSASQSDKLYTVNVKLPDC